MVARQHRQRFGLRVSAPPRLFIRQTRDGLFPDHLNTLDGEVGEAAEKAVQPALQRPLEHLVEHAVIGVPGL